MAAQNRLLLLFLLSLILRAPGPGADGNENNEGQCSRADDAGCHGPAIPDGVPCRHTTASRSLNQGLTHLVRIRQKASNPAPLNSIVQVEGSGAASVVVSTKPLNSTGSVAV